MQDIEQSSISKRAEALVYELERSMADDGQTNHQQHGQMSQEDIQLYGEEGTCSLCSKTFARKSSLLTHIRNHSAERKFICSFCQKGFTQAANLRNHERIHTNIRPYVCSDCGKAFTQITNLNNHRRLHTGERPFVCIEPDCGRSFAQVTNLNNHMKSHHKIQQYVCNQCPRRFTQVTSLNQHLLFHSGLAHFYCPQCPEKTFKQQSQLQQHMRTHGCRYPFECQICEEKFLQLTHLNQHMVMHQEYRFRCTMCVSSFNQESLLKKHVQRHLDGRYLACPVANCTKGFSVKNQLAKHLNSSHPNQLTLIETLNSGASQKPSSKHFSNGNESSDNTDKSHHCYFDNCENVFSSESDLNDHLTQTHGLSVVVTTNSAKRNKGNLRFANPEKVLKIEDQGDEQSNHQQHSQEPRRDVQMPHDVHHQQHPLHAHHHIIHHHQQQQQHHHHHQQQLQAHQQQLQLQHHNHMMASIMGEHEMKIEHLAGAINHAARDLNTESQHREGNLSIGTGYKCLVCNINYDNVRDLRVHNFYKHPEHHNKLHTEGMAH